MKNQYPYFIYPEVMTLREGNLPEEEEKRLRRIIAANVGNRESLRIMLGLSPEEFACFYPDMHPKSSSTTDTIDAFLKNFGTEEAPLPEAVDEIEQGVLSLKELIAMQRYEEAMQRILDKNLNNSEKNIYFADQIRFLKKLMFNRDYNKRPKSEGTA